MKVSNIKQNEVYRLKTSPNYGFVKCICVLPARTEVSYFENNIKKYEKNSLNYCVVKCIHSSNDNFDFGLIRYFKPNELIK